MTITPIAYHRNISNLYKMVNLTIPCEAVSILPFAHIFATDISITPTTCTEPCTLTINVTYKNDGGISGAIIPTIIVDGNPITLSSIVLDPSTTTMQTFTVSNMKSGYHTICVEPLGNTTCQTINVKVQVSAAGLPLFLGAGLLIGFLVKKEKECRDYKTKEECQKNECQWKKNKEYKCIPLSSEDKYLVKKLRERGAVGIPECTGQECRIGKWLAVARPKGQEPIIIHDP